MHCYLVSSYFLLYRYNMLYRYLAFLSNFKQPYLHNY
jgi:hypothetical protein